MRRDFFLCILSPHPLRLEAREQYLPLSDYSPRKRRTKTKKHKKKPWCKRGGDCWGGAALLPGVLAMILRASWLKFVSWLKKASRRTAKKKSATEKIFHRGSPNSKLKGQNHVGMFGLSPCSTPPEISEACIYVHIFPCIFIVLATLFDKKLLLLPLLLPLPLLLYW